MLNIFVFRAVLFLYQIYVLIRDKCNIRYINFRLDFSGILA